MSKCNKHDWDEKTSTCLKCGAIHFGTVHKRPLKGTKEKGSMKEHTTWDG